jgi:hypothetical protein
MIEKSRWLMVAAGAAALAALPAGAGGNTPGPATPNADGRYLPDLVQIMPGSVHIDTRRSRRGTRTLLTFSSAVANAGAGPMIVRARRPVPSSSSTMPAWQVVARSDGRRERVGGPMRIRFVNGGGHSHWHLEDFQRFELRTVGGRTLRRDRKTGFCLGDRYDASGTGTRMPGEPARAVYRHRCGLGQPLRTSLSQGISVGFGDDYPAGLEGQYVDITGLRTGRYVLVHRVDPNGAIVDMHDDNDVSSMLVKIVRGSPTRARILSWCNSTDSCPVPGVRSARRR